MDYPSTSGDHNYAANVLKRSVDRCFVPMCTSTSAKFPSKIFLSGPSNPQLRKKWFQAAKRNDTISPKTVIRCCEDHFDLERDVENWIKFKIFGGNLYLKKDVVPHFFECQNRMMPMKPRTAVLKRNRLEILKSIENTPDILKTFPSAATKIETGEFHLQDDLSSLYPPSPPEAKPSRAELASDLLQQLENQCKQENIFSNWLEEKVDLPIFENITQAAEPVEPAPVYIAPGPQPTEDLLREFETVYGAVELTHLTPPQSPPGPATQLLLSYAQQAQCPAPVHEPWPQQPQLHLPVPAEYDRELEAVEELVRHRASQLASPQPSGDSSIASPRSSPPSSPRSSTDEEWSLPSGRPKPYSRGDDRRSRKKEQNKNAATRYRQKKKAEIEVLLGEEQQLRARHGELDSKCADLQREIRYLKSLMRDLFKAKGLIK